MPFERAAALARATPTEALCDAWAANSSDVLSCQKGERPMTIREVGALAEIHGMKLLDVLTL